MPSISFRLEQASHDINVPYGHGRGFVLKADELLIFLGKAETEIFPPPFCVASSASARRSARRGPVVW